MTEDEESLGAMETWQDLNKEERERSRTQENLLWQILEEDKEVPPPALLRLLSGLLDERRARARKAWPGLPLDVRRTLARELRETAGEDFMLDLSGILRIALQDTDAEIRALAIEGLNEVADVTLVPALTQLLRNDPIETVRAAAAAALGTYVLEGELENIRPAQFNATVLALRDSYLDPSETTAVRAQALRSIGYTQEYDVPEMIVNAYENADETLRISAVTAMGRSANHDWATIVLRELGAAAPDMRLEATVAMGELQFRAAAEEIVELADDTDQRIRAAALWALGQIGGKVAGKTLRSYVGVQDEALRAVAENALRELEFFDDNLSDFFDPPGGIDNEADALWHLPGLLGQDTDSEDDDQDDEDYP